MFMVLSWVYASSMVIKSIVLEKELKLKEVMKVMGLENGVIWAGWFIESFIMMSLSATVLTLILKVIFAVSSIGLFFAISYFGLTLS